MVFVFDREPLGGGSVIAGRWIPGRLLCERLLGVMLAIACALCQSVVKEDSCMLCMRVLLMCSPVRPGNLHCWTSLTKSGSELDR